MFVGAPFELTFRAYKFLWLRGRTGGGKTSLAFALALSLLRDGLVKRIYSNIPSVGDFPEWGKDGLNSAYVIDEGGLFMKSSKQFQTVAGALRKAGNYVIISSVIPPAREFATLSVERKMNLSTVIGYPIWVYEYELSSGSTRDKGTFAWLNPQSVWGLYDTDFYPSDDGGIEEFLLDEITSKLSKKANRYSRSKYKAGAYKTKGASSNVEMAEGEKGAGAPISFEGMEQAAQGFEGAAARIESALGRLRKKVLR